MPKMRGKGKIPDTPFNAVFMFEQNWPWAMMEAFTENNAALPSVLKSHTFDFLKLENTVEVVSR